MKKIKYITLSAIALLACSIVVVSCQKDVAPAAAAPSVAPPVPDSYTEEFNNVGGLVAKGWVTKNHSFPQGANSWGQGRYENNLGGSKGGFVVGMPAYSSTNSPHDFISVDATCVNSKGAINCWLITPPTNMKNGDVISFYTAAMDDSQWSNFSIDRMQVRANITDATDDCGANSTDFGKFTKLLVDLNPNYGNNFGATSFANGYIESWTKVTITISGLTAPVKGRIAFRYLADDGGISGLRGSSLIGVDQFNFFSN
jgi:hypothetical protein